MERNEAYQGIYMKDVWGETTGSDDPRGSHKRVTNGMMVARGLPYKEGSPEALKIQQDSLAPVLPQRCPVLGDLLPYKSVSIICEQKDYNAVTYWLEYVHGGGCISNQKETKDGKIFIRSDYQC